MSVNWEAMQSGVVRVSSVDELVGLIRECGKKEYEVLDFLKSAVKNVAANRVFRKGYESGKKELKSENEVLRRKVLEMEKKLKNS